MRTPEQIKNLRNVLITMYGPGALLLSDETINYWADTLQARINSEFTEWRLRVRLASHKDCPWSGIEPEPKYQHCSKIEITDACRRLLDKYPQIVEIGISKANSSEITVIRRLVEGERKNVESTRI